MTIKHLQWNIWYKEKIGNVVQLIKELDPDVVSLQELAVDCVDNLGIANTADYVAEKTGMHFYFKEANRWEDDHEMKAIGNGIFSKYPLLRTFARHVQEPSAEFTDYSHEGRVYIEADVKVGDAMVTVGTAHLSYVPRFEITEAKKNEVDNLLPLLKSKGYIFSGDLNSAPDSYTVTKLTKILRHCGPDFSEKTWTTKPFDHDSFKEYELNWRLDYVFVSSDMRCTSSEIIKTDFSDHLPIMSTFDL